jgi:WXXGXW repeat (2 copies)
MNTRKTLLAMALAASSLGMSLATHAAVNIDIDVAPPAPRYENAPPREGYIYAPGYYKWDEGHHEHVWTKGEYQPERRGEHFVPQRWTQQNGKYHFDEGRWEKGEKGQ